MNCNPRIGAAGAPVERLCRSRVDARQKARHIATAMGVALALGVFPQQGSAQSISQAKLVSTFDKACLETGAAFAPVMKVTSQLGLKRRDTHQWSNSKTTLNVHLFTSSIPTAPASIKANKITKNGPDFIAVNMAKHSGYKGTGTGCAVSAYDVPIEGLATLLGQHTVNYGGQVKVRSQGRVGRANVQLAGKKAQTRSRPLKVGKQLLFVLLSVVRED